MISNTKLNEALDNAYLVYQDLVDIADNIVKQYTNEVDDLIDEAYKNVYSMSNDYLRDFILKLSLLSYRFSDIKEKASTQAVCAEILRKESYAKSFNEVTGSVASKEATALLNISYEVLTETTYDLASNLLKVKLDEVHRVVDSLKTVLMSRMQEAKLSNIGGE